MKSLTRLYYLLLAVTLVLLVPATSRAQLIFTAGNVSAVSGSSGSFDLTLKNNGPDLDLASLGANLLLTDNPAFDVTLDNASPGSQGQFLPFETGGSPFSIAAGQTINLGKIGFQVAPGAAANVVGVTFADTFGIKFGSVQNVPSTGVNGSITVLGPPLIFSADNVTVSPGGSGSFALTLKNIGPNLDLGGFAAFLFLTNNPTLDVTLDQSFLGSQGQSFQYLTESPFSIATGQTITLETVGFHVAPGATANTVGIDLSGVLGRTLHTLAPMPGTGVNGSITVLGPSSVPEPGAVALLTGFAIPGAALLLRRRRR